MNINITFRGVEHTPVLENYVYEQLERFNRALSDEHEPIYIEFVLNAERNHHHHHVEIRVKTPRYHIITHYETFDMYETINKAVERMHDELAKELGRLDDREKKVDEY